MCIWACGNAYLDLTKVKNVGIVHGMNYTPRKVFEDFHTANWHRCVLLCHRRAGKSYASAAEMLRRAYNGPEGREYFWCSPLAEQAEATVLGIFQTLDNGEGYIVKYDKTTQTLRLANGAIIQLGGARTISKMRGRSLAGCILDEANDIPPEAYTDVLSYALADQNGWCGFLGTTHVSNDYRLYRMYKQYENDPNWFTKKVSCYDNPEAFSAERIKEIHDEQIQYALSNGLSLTQAEQSFNVEFGLDFSFLDTGRPNVSAMFYQELQALFDSNPSRLLEPLSDEITKIPSASKTAVFDISHSAARDYTCCFIIAETTTSPVVINIVWENNKSWAHWFEYLRNQDIRTVALPFDANTVSKESMLTLTQLFKREGFNVVRIKRLLREEQKENGRWLINNARFSKDCIPGLSQVGMFNDFSTRHGLSQDVVAALLYAGQVAKKSHIKTEHAETIRKNYDNNPDAYSYGVDLYGGTIGGEF